jgi:signal transduction histidine kinase
VKGMRSLLLIGLLQCCLVQAVFSQNFHYSLRNYSAAEGLPQSQVTNIHEDQNGYLWIGTQGGGLARFDGREFKVYTSQDSLLANEVVDIHFDKQQRLWALHQHGISRFDGLHFKTFQIPDSLSASSFHKIYELNDTIFLVSMAGLRTKIYKNEAVYWEKPFLDKRVRQVHIAPNGDAVIQIGNGKIFVQTNNSMDSVPITDVGKLYNFFTWKKQVLARGEKGIFKLDFAKHKFSKLSWNTKASIIKYDSLRNIFWTTDGNHLFKECVKNEVPFQCDTLLHDVRVSNITFDSEGNTWIGSDGYGLYRYYMMDFEKVTPPNIRGVMALLVDQDSNTWIGTMGRGLWRMKNGKLKSYFNPEVSSQNSVNSIKQLKDGTIYIATHYGVGKYDQANDAFKWLTTKDGLPSNFVFIVEPDDLGGLWIGTNKGVSYYNGDTIRTLSEKEGIKRDLACWTLHYSETYKTLFIGTDVEVVAVHENKARVVSALKERNAVITSMHEYRDSLLVLSTGGAGTIILDPRKGANFFITAHDGLASDFNYFTGEDESGYLWIGSEKGINKIKLDKNNEIVQNLHYGFDNGLTGVETNQNAFVLNGGRKYFGLVDGLYTFNEQQPLSNAKSFDLHLSGVEILYGEYEARNYADSVYGSFKIPYHPLLPPDRNHVTFHFNRVDKRHPNSVKYKYFLENFDKAWSLPSSMQQVTYGNLPPGDYVLRVKATNSTGSWSANEINYPFTVLTPFYMRASSIIGLFILLAGVITLALYLRVKQRIKKAIQVERIRAQEQEMLRKEIARDFHDEMGNQLTRIINYVSLLKLNSNGNGNGNGNGTHNHTELYGKVEESAKYLYTGTRDFIWAIDPVNDELSKLFIHIRDFGEKLFEEKNISFRAYNNLKESIKLPYGFSREANFIFKEAMTNAFKYSQANNVTFSLQHHEDCYEMIFEDDGVGFYAGEIEKTNGLKNIRERANRINAILRICSNKNQGTKITLNFKLSKNVNYGYAL